MNTSAISKAERVIKHYGPRATLKVLRIIEEELASDKALQDKFSSIDGIYKRLNLEYQQLCDKYGYTSVVADDLKHDVEYTVAVRNLLMEVLYG